MKTTAKKLIVQLLTVIIFLSPYYAVSQDYASNSIKKRQKELDRINNSIKETRKKINTLNKKERTTINELNTNQQQSLSLNRYLVLLNEQIIALQNDINRHDSVYYGLSDKLRRMISEYTELARQTYIEGNISDGEVLLTDKSFDNDMRREIYMDKLTGLFKDNMKKINLMRVAVSNEAGILKDKSDYQAELKETKNREQQHLAFTITKNKRLLDKIKTDSKLLNNQLKEKSRSAEKIRSIIAELISKDAEKNNIPKKSKSITGNNKRVEEKYLPIGKVPWPVDSRTIYRNYGQIKNKETNTIFENPGIDIVAQNGTIVKTIADGEVSIVHWLPGYGTLVILNHGNGLRSVYANLSSVNVKKGDRIKKGNALGKTGESVDGEFLHFELWQGNKRLNPSSYLH